MEHYTHNFEKVIEKTECKECDNSALLLAINKLREDFKAIKIDAMPSDNTALLKELERTRNALIARIDGIKVGGDTGLTKEVINRLIALRTDIKNCCEQKLVMQQPLQPQPLVRGATCSNGECCERPEEIERTITEKIRRNSR